MNCFEIACQNNVFNLCVSFMLGKVGFRIARELCSKIINKELDKEGRFSSVQTGKGDSNKFSKHLFWKVFVKFFISFFIPLPHTHTHTHTQTHQNT